MAGGQFGFSTEVIPTEDATPPEFSRAAEQLAEQGFAVSEPSPSPIPRARPRGGVVPALAALHGADERASRGESGSRA